MMHYCELPPCNRNGIACKNTQYKVSSKLIMRVYISGKLNYEAAKFLSAKISISTVVATY